MDELYEELETPDGERKISQMAKANDFTKNNQIKDDLDRIMGRWKGYFDKLLNWENHRFVFDVMMECQMRVNTRTRQEWGKSNVITNEEGRDNGNGWDSRGCVDVFGRRRDWHVINMMQGA